MHLRTNVFTTNPNVRRTRSGDGSAAQERRGGEAGARAELGAHLHVAGEVHARVHATQACLLGPPAELVRARRPQVAQDRRSGVGRTRVPGRVSGILRELADRADINRIYVGMLEREENAATVDMLEKLSAVLEVDPVELLRRDRE